MSAGSDKLRRRASTVTERFPCYDEIPQQFDQRRRAVTVLTPSRTDVFNEASDC